MTTQEADELAVHQEFCLGCTDCECPLTVGQQPCPGCQEKCGQCGDDALD